MVFTYIKPIRMMSYVEAARLAKRRRCRNNVPLYRQKNLPLRMRTLLKL
jgi:hypothetical protein